MLICANCEAECDRECQVCTEPVCDGCVVRCAYCNGKMHPECREEHMCEGPDADYLRDEALNL